MATIKLKFRPSTVQGKAGTLCYQLCHRQENRQITTDRGYFPSGGMRRNVNLSLSPAMRES